MIRPQCRLLLVVCIFGVIFGQQVLAQSRPPAAGTSSLCTRTNAVDMIKQQVDLARTLNSPVRRITVLVRSADLLWPEQQDKARAVFKEAFELALLNEKDNAKSSRPRSVLLRMQVPDQRYVVVRAVAKRDPAWARELTRQMLKADTQDRESSATRDSLNDLETAQRLLESASQLIASDFNAAMDLARASLSYPASSWLTRFLYRVAEVNQQAADQFYARALANYADKPMREFLYLQAYPFAWRDTLNTPIFSYYVVPASFATNQALQRQFVLLALRRAQQALEAPLDEGEAYQAPSGTLTPAPVNLLHGLVRLEPQVRTSLPDLLAPLTQAREKILVSLSVENQKLFLQSGREVLSPDEATEETFKEQIENAEKTPNVNLREDLIAQAVLNEVSDLETVAEVVEAIDKITDSSIRSGLLDTIYFRRATAAVTDRQVQEAERLAARVTGHEQRAYLHIEIAKVLLTTDETQTHARELLEEAITEAKKAGATIFAARSLLTASQLYTKIDLGRAIAVLADAINGINRIDDPDFSADGQALEKLVRRRSNPGHFVFRFYMPGLDPETAFREMAKTDFDNSLYQSNALTDKFQRAMSALSLADVCLQQPKEKPKKSGRP